MFGLMRIIRRIVENPKLLIAVVVLVPLGLLADYALSGSWGNPLPDPDDVVKVSFTPSAYYGREQPPPRNLDLALYAELWDCLDGAKSLFASGVGEQAGTLVIHQTDGATHQADLYVWGLVGTNGGLFQGCDDETCQRLARVIRKIRP